MHCLLQRGSSGKDVKAAVINMAVTGPPPQPVDTLYKQAAQSRAANLDSFTLYQEFFLDFNN